ncbi:hypothetical protein [Serinicoccus kebangsaanensis]|uniref:hypothetical protein n=1 Tax=Serinicoccus kebangsaanensis TaxID=2602069 RepID=UPI00124EF3C4|nr:hypothetical protein [Serinicoccus kebangsaanensis]
MRSQDLPRLLREAGDEAAEPDLARSTWERGRRSRRRRLVLTGTTGLAALALGVTALTLSRPDLPGAEPAGRGGAAVGGAAIELPVDGATTDPGGQAERVWRTLYTACLEDLDYEVAGVSDDGGLAATKLGVQAGERDRDLRRCRAELVLDSPVTLAASEEPAEGPWPATGEFPAETSSYGMDQSMRVVLTARYHEYFIANACLQEADLPTSVLPPAEDFIHELAREQLPAWHPYLEAAEQGRYADARAACPLTP